MKAKHSKILELMGAFILSWTTSVCAQEEHHMTTTDTPPQEAGITVGAGAHTDHGSKHGGVLGMVGDYHLELVNLATEFRLYLFDAFTKPISTAGLSGNLAYYAVERTGDKASVASETWLPLRPDPASEYLVAAKVPGPEPNEVTVVLQLRGEDLEMTFPL